MSQTTNTDPVCFFCDVVMVLKTVFGKQVWECPRCKRRVPAEDAVAMPDTSAAG